MRRKSDEITPPAVRYASRDGIITRMTPTRFSTIAVVIRRPCVLKPSLVPLLAKGMAAKKMTRTTICSPKFKVDGNGAGMGVIYW